MDWASLIFSALALIAMGDEPGRGAKEPLSRGINNDGETNEGEASLWSDGGVDESRCAKLKGDVMNDHPRVVIRLGDGLIEVEPKASKVDPGGEGKERWSGVRIKGKESERMPK